MDLIVQETKYYNEQGKDFDVAQAVVAQLPHFACPNVLVSKQAQRDISRYIYCTNFNVSPYEGSYGEHPAEWVAKSFVIRKALAKIEKRSIDGSRSNKKSNG